MKKIDTAKLAADLEKISNCIKLIVAAGDKPLTITSYEGDNRDKLDAIANNVNTSLNTIISNLEKMQSDISDVNDAYNLGISNIGAINTGSGGESAE